MFITCGAVWDESKKKWIENDVTEKVKCCHNQCNGPVKFCYDYCAKNIVSDDVMEKYKCSELCEQQRKICLETCSLIGDSVGENNKYKECAIKNGCELIDGTLNLECLEKNKTDTLLCCAKSCTSSSDVDCDKNCKYLHSFYSNQPPPLIKPKIPSVIKRTVIERTIINDSPWYITYKIIIIMNISIIILYSIFVFFVLINRN